MIINEAPVLLEYGTSRGHHATARQCARRSACRAAAVASCGGQAVAAAAACTCGQRGGRSSPAPRRFTRKRAIGSTRPLRVELEASRRVAREASAASVRRARAASARRARGERATSGRASCCQLLEGEREHRMRAVRAALAVRDRRERAARSSRRTRAARRRDRESTRAELARLGVERATRGGARPGLSAENGGSLRITRSRYVQLSRATASAALSSSVSAEPRPRTPSRPRFNARRT